MFAEEESKSTPNNMSTELKLCRLFWNIIGFIYSIKIRPKKSQKNNWHTYGRFVNFKFYNTVIVDKVNLF